MTIFEFHKKFVTTLSTAPISEHIRTEKELETQFVIPVGLQVSSNRKDIRLFSHPWNNKTHCQPDCRIARNHDKIVIGCPLCWRESKKWAKVLAFGSDHTFDFVAKDVSGKTLAVEIKLVSSKKGRMPNSEIQRFVGQCSLAKTKHDLVVGVCGYRGSLNLTQGKDTQIVKDWFASAGIQLIFRAVG